MVALFFAKLNDLATSKDTIWQGSANLERIPIYQSPQDVEIGFYLICIYQFGCYQITEELNTISNRIKHYARQRIALRIMAGATLLLLNNSTCISKHKRVHER